MSWLKWVPVVGQVAMVIERFQENKRRRLELEILKEKAKILEKCE